MAFTGNGSVHLYEDLNIKKWSFSKILENKAGVELPLQAETNKHTENCK